jgi:hypothetical protein
MKSLLTILLLCFSVAAFSQSANFSTLKVKTSVQLGTTKWTGIVPTTFGTDSTSTAKGASIRAITNWANGRLAELFNYVNSAEAIGLHNTDDGTAGVAVGVGTNIIYFRSFLGANGTSVTQQDSTITIDRQILSGSATLDFPSTAAQTSSALTITVTGAALGDCVSLGFGNASITTGQIFTAEVTATNTVTVIFLNASASAADPASAVFNVRVIK